MPDTDYSQVNQGPMSPVEAAMDYFKTAGYSPQAAAGIVGNLYLESSGLQSDIKEAGGKGPGFGLAQWTTPDRKAGLLQYAAAKGEKTPSFGTQLEYVDQELQNNPGYGLDKLKQAQTPEEAAQIFSDTYERPGVPAMAKRQGYASQIYSAFFAPGEAQAADLPTGGVSAAPVVNTPPQAPSSPSQGVSAAPVVNTPPQAPSSPSQPDLSKLSDEQLLQQLNQKSTATPASAPAATPVANITVGGVEIPPAMPISQAQPDLSKLSDEQLLQALNQKQNAAQANQQPTVDLTLGLDKPLSKPTNQETTFGGTLSNIAEGAIKGAYQVGKGLADVGQKTVDSALTANYDPGKSLFGNIADFLGGTPTHEGVLEPAVHTTEDLIKGVPRMAAVAGGGLGIGSDKEFEQNMGGTLFNLYMYGKGASELKAPLSEVASNLGADTILNKVGDALIERGQQNYQKASLKGLGPIDRTRSAVDLEAQNQGSRTVYNTNFGNAANQGYEQGLPFNIKGLVGLNDTMGQLNSSIGSLFDQETDNAARLGDKTIPIQNVISNLEETKSNLIGLDAAKNGRIIDRKIEALKNEPTVQTDENGQQVISLEDAHNLKKDIYKDLAQNAYNPLKNSTKGTQIDKQIAANLNDAIRAEIPGYQDLNAQDKNMIDFKPVLERAVSKSRQSWRPDMVDAAATGGSAASIAYGHVGLGVGEILTDVARKALQDPGVQARVALAQKAVGNWVKPSVNSGFSIADMPPEQVDNVKAVDTKLSSMSPEDQNQIWTQALREYQAREGLPTKSAEESARVFFPEEFGLPPRPVQSAAESAAAFTKAGLRGEFAPPDEPPTAMAVRQPLAGSDPLSRNLGTKPGELEPGQYVGEPLGRKDFRLAGARPDFSRPQETLPEGPRPAIQGGSPGMRGAGAAIQSLEPGQYVGEPLGRNNIQLSSGRPDFTKPQEIIGDQPRLAIQGGNTNFSSAEPNIVKNHSEVDALAKVREGVAARYEAEAAAKAKKQKQIADITSIVNDIIERKNIDNSTIPQDNGLTKIKPNPTEGENMAWKTGSEAVADKSKHLELDKQVDALTKEQASNVAAELGIKEQKFGDVRDKIKLEHPDDQAQALAKMLNRGYPE